MTFGIRPVPEDPAKETVKSFLAINDSWALAAGGDYETFAVEAMTNDGKNFQRLIAIQFPCRLNKTDEHVTIRMLLEPEDAVGLADSLVHTARWMAAAAELRKQGRI